LVRTDVFRPTVMLLSTFWVLAQSVRSRISYLAFRPGQSQYLNRAAKRVSAFSDVIMP
jgi:hypothetical protein